VPNCLRHAQARTGHWRTAYLSVENTRPQAQTNPVYVIRFGTTDSRSGIGSVFREVDRSFDGHASAYPGWRSDKEKAHVLAQFAEARAVYEKRSQ
jgi:hypothetical protein